MQHSRSSRFNSFLAAVWRGLVELNFISATFTWLMELLARITEPLASLSAIYIIIVAGVPQLLNGQLYTLALALIIGSPELLVVGAFKIASHEIAGGNKRGWWLMSACLVLLILTALTVGDLFMWHWQPAAVNILMGFRCLAGITYSFTRGVVTDHGSLFTHSQVHSLEQMMNDLLQRVNLVNQQTLDEVNRVNQAILAEVNRVNQFTLAEVQRLNNDLALRTQSLLQRVNQVNQDLQVSICEQNQQIVEAAVERLERSNSRRLEAVYSRLEQVTVTLESNPALPAVHQARMPLRLPSRDTRQSSGNLEAQPGEPVNLESEPGGSSLSADPRKVNLGREFTVNHWHQHGTLPTLAMIMATVACSKGLASRAYNLAKQDLGLVARSGD
jgi:hypothetical protein